VKKFAIGLTIVIEAPSESLHRGLKKLPLNG
jgi:hypothetical protein